MIATEFESQRPIEKRDKHWNALRALGVSVRGHEDHQSRTKRRSWQSAWRAKWGERLLTYGKKRTPYAIGRNRDMGKRQAATVTIILWRTETFEELTEVIAHCCMASDRPVRVFDVRGLPP